MSENGEICTAGKKFTLPLAVTGWTNSTSDPNHICERCFFRPMEKVQVLADELENANGKICKYLSRAYLLLNTIAKIVEDYSVKFLGCR